jgi:hypothetical protein
LPEAPEDPLALAVRAGLPAEMLYLRDGFPRERWTGLPEIAAFWLQMHAGFRGHQGYMDGLVSQWRTGGDIRELHRQLVPAVQSFLQHLDGHHRIESGQYFPRMRRLEPKIGHGLDLLDRDHDVIHAALETMFQGGLAFHQAVMAKDADAPDRAARLADALDGAAPLLLRHLEDEEDIVVPLIHLHGDALH